MNFLIDKWEQTSTSGENTLAKAAKFLGRKILIFGKVNRNQQYIGTCKSVPFPASNEETENG